MAWIQYLRIGAAFAVVVLHVAAPIATGGPRFGLGWWGATFLDSASRWCVPVFVMASGFLLLGKQNEGAVMFYKKRAGRILVPAILWIGLYSIYNLIRCHEPRITFDQQWRLVLAGRPFYHLWFIYMLMGLYFYTPFLRIMIAAMSRRKLGWLCVLLFLNTYLAMLVAAVSRQNEFSAINLNLMFLGYFIFGWWMAGSNCPFRTTWLVVVYAIMTVLTFGICCVLRLKANVTMYSFHSPIIVVMAAAIFQFARLRLGQSREGAWLTPIGGATLGIYLVHPVLLDQLRQHYEYSVWAIPSVSVLIFLVSLGIVLCFKRIPGLSWTV